MFSFLLRKYLDGKQSQELRSAIHYLWRHVFLVVRLLKTQVVYYVAGMKVRARKDGALYIRYM